MITLKCSINQTTAERDFRKLIEFNLVKILLICGMDKNIEVHHLES